MIYVVYYNDNGIAEIRAIADPDTAAAFAGDMQEHIDEYGPSGNGRLIAIFEGRQLTLERSYNLGGNCIAVKRFYTCFTTHDLSP